MGRIIGIDLGTTSSYVAILENGNVKIIESAKDARTAPSIIAYTNDDEALVGQLAKRQAVTNPQNTLYAVERLVGRRFEENMVQEGIQMVPYSIAKADNGNARVEMKGQKMAPPQISAEALKKMKKTTEDYLGEPAAEVMITAPAYFDDNQRQAIKDADRIAGLDVKRIIGEPTATALVYGLDKAGDDHTVIVYNLGGGTFDVSVIEVTETDGKHQSEVLTTNGNTPLGGEGFDIHLIDYLVDELKKENGIGLRGNPLTIQRLKKVAKKAKVGLSSTQQTDVNPSYMAADASGPKHPNIKVSRAKLRSLVRDLMRRTAEPCRTALKDVGLDVSDIREVILVDGQTRMPLIQKTVARFFDKKTCKGVDPDEAVTVGVTIQGAVLADDVRNVLLLNVAPLTLSIEALGGVAAGLIEKNTTVPTKKSQVLSIADDNQGAVAIHVLQDEHKQAVQSKSLGKFDLADIPPTPHGVPQIGVTSNVDANGILRASTRDRATDKQQSTVIRASSGLSEDETQQIIHDTEVSVEEDCKFEGLTAACSQGDALVHATHKMITEVSDKAAAEDKAAIEKVLGELETTAKGNNEAEIETKMNALSQAFTPLAQKMYTGQIQQGENASQGEQAKTADSVTGAEFEEVKDNEQIPACFCLAYRPNRYV